MTSDTDSLEREVQDAIKKLLPQQVGVVLQHELEELKRLRGVDADFQTLRNANLTMSNELQSVRDQLDAFKKKAKQIEERELALYQQELALDKAMLAVRLEEAEKRSAIGIEIVKAVFQNRNIVESHSIHYPNGTYPLAGTDGRLVPPVPGGVETVRTGE